MERLIDAMKTVTNLSGRITPLIKIGENPMRVYQEVLQVISEATTVDAVEVVHGHDTGRCRIFQCSECGYGVIDMYQEDENNYPVGEFNYCPNCGAKMDGGHDG